MRKQLLALLLALTGVAFGQERIGDWTITTKTDIFTDETTAYAALFPLEHPSGGVGDALVVGCFEHDVAPLGATILARSSMPIIGDDVEVLYRVDDREAVTRMWWSNGQSVGPLTPSAQREVLTDLIGGERFALRYTALGNVRTYVYVVTGFREVLAVLGCYTGEL